MKDDAPFQVSINSRVMIDAIFFRKINLNYARPRVIEIKKPKSSFFGIDEDDSTISVDEVISNRKKPLKLQEDELLTCYPTVPGFSFSDRL